MATTTLLFADQVGSTAQLGALGDRAIVPVRQTLLDGMQEAVVEQGGTVHTVEGDGLFATFNSAVDGVAAAVTMQQAVALSNLARPPERQVAVRVGLHSGEPVENERGDLYGLAVVVARRLCDEAQAGEVVVSDLVRGLVEPRREHRFEAVGHRTLKGITDPVPVARVGWQPMPPVVPPPPDLPRVVLPPGGLQLGAVGELWRAATTGERRIVAAGGPAPRRRALAAALAEQAEKDGGVVFHAQPVSPASSWDSLFLGVRPYLESAPTALIRMQAGPYSGALLRAVPSAAERFTTAVATDGDQAGAFGQLVVAVAAMTPLLLVVDDAHLASDEAVTMLSRCISDDGPPLHLLVVLLHDASGLDGAAALRQIVRSGTEVAPSRPERPRVGKPTAAWPSSDPPPSEGPLSTVDALGLDISTQGSATRGEDASIVLPDGGRIVLDLQRGVVGRLPDSTIPVDDIDVSRRHAVIRALGPSWIVEDLGSTNGTYVNEVQVRDQILAHGDVIRVGSTRLRFELRPHRS